MIYLYKYDMRSPALVHLGEHVEDLEKRMDEVD